MLLFIFLVIAEFFTPFVLKQHYFNNNRGMYFVTLTAHVILSAWTWINYIGFISYDSFFDNPRHVWLMMNMAGIIVAIIFPRILLIILHFTGRIINFRNGTEKRRYTNTGLGIMAFILIVTILSAGPGRFHFTTEEVVLGVKDLNKDLDGIKIVQISDLHLNSFYHHKQQLAGVMEKVNQLKPDLLINTGDFVSFGWRETERYDTILSHASGRFGNFAILGNHDAGTYNPDFTEADKRNNILLINRFIKASGYDVLEDENRIIKVGSASISISGVTTGGRHPDMTHGDLGKALKGTDSADFKLLLTHDPNHWAESVTGKTDVNLTLSGHTHGMQMGILTKKFKWSPSKYFYPHWNGLYKTGDQYQYVNRGLGCLAIPFRIWMPPEITLITLKRL